MSTVHRLTNTVWLGSNALTLARVVVPLAGAN
jgi:hypothetical protein